MTATRRHAGTRATVLPHHRLMRLRAIVAAGLFGGALLALSALSMQVAAARARVAGLDRTIAGTRSDYATLRTEFDIRSRPDALLDWGAGGLALAPPRVHQYLAGLGQLQTLARPVPSPDETASR